jgi:hypothetical protein
MQDTTEAHERVERLRAEAAELGVKAGAHRRDGVLQVLGLVLMAAAVVVTLLAYQISLGSDDQRDIQSLIVLAIAMLALAVLGGALFLRYSMSRFLRFWLLRQLYEQQRD